MSQYSQQHFGNYKIQEFLRSENNIQLYTATCQLDQKKVLAKIIQKSQCSQVFISDYHKIKTLFSDHTVKIYDFYEDGSLYIIYSEYLPKTLEQLMQQQKLSLEQAQSIFAQIAKGYDYLKSNGISHQNLSPSTILIDELENVKLDYYGLAPQLRNSSLVYNSPQYLKDKTQINIKNDIWSMGIILYQLVFNQLPFQSCFDESSQIQEFQRIENDEIKITDQELQQLDEQQLPDTISILLKSMIKYRENDRITISEVSFRNKEIYKYVYEPRKQTLIQQSQQQQNQANQAQQGIQELNINQGQQQYQQGSQGSSTNNTNNSNQNFQQQNEEQKQNFQQIPNNFSNQPNFNNNDNINNNYPGFDDSQQHRRYQINLEQFGTFPKLIASVNSFEQKRIIEEQQSLYYNNQENANNQQQQQQDPDQQRNMEIMSSFSQGEVKAFSNLTIPTYSFRETSFIKKTAFYQICAYINNTNEIINVERRYSQFEDLHHYLHNKVQLLNLVGVIIPNLPPPDMNLDSIKLQAVNLFKSKDEELTETEFLKKRQLDLQEYLIQINQIEFVNRDSVFTLFLTQQDFDVPKLKIKEENESDFQQSLNRQKESIKSKGFGSYLSNKFKKAKDSTMAFGSMVFDKNKGQLEANQDWIYIQKIEEEVKNIEKNINAQVLKTLTLQEQSKLRMIKGYAHSQKDVYNRLQDWHKKLQYLVNLERERDSLEAKQKVQERFNRQNNRFIKACSIFRVQVTEIKQDMANNLQYLLRLVGDRVH